MEIQRRANAPAATLDQMKDRTRERSLPGLVLGPGAQEPLGLSFRNASLREVYQALGKAAGVNFVFDPEFQDQPITIDLQGRAASSRPSTPSPAWATPSTACSTRGWSW